MKLSSLYWFLKSHKRGAAIAEWVVSQAAFIWRRLLFNTTFIAITGSAGKTTTKEFLASILEQHYSVVRTPGNWNHRKYQGPEMTILKTRPWHKFVVMELGIEIPGDMAPVAQFVNPDLVLMLDIKLCHTNTFKTLESIAQEKSQLLKHVKSGGCAVLNQDNPYVAEMATKPGTKLIRFGKSESADIRLVHAESNWPERLRLHIVYEGKQYEVDTRLVGTHWAPTILASLAAAIHCGVPVQDAINAIRTIEPFWARLQPISLPAYGNATILRDEFNGSIDTFDAALTVLADANAARKIVIFSDFSDSKKKDRVRASYLGKISASLADIAIFVGDYANRSKEAAIEAGLSEDCVYAFFDPAEVTAFLKQFLREDGLVLIKGKASHHLSRIYLGLFGQVTCTLSSCSMQILCDRCSRLGFVWHPEIQGYMAPPDSAA
ncbi:UDP-N-acetylmuramyl pentapeptide synthase [Nitrosomonas nitrosa]|uniref:UDP-N-acetylmuramyl pentapeptide synthase n=1 Tax=Nitrosomonas nitrosa TaxID=52442 RepID=A0A1I4R8F2_9PROT|nr:UDP-N-acetylmuramoyl-tripeptide--D-alanyl-D-alanine ligase [Nitrosomonas nitrosa]SFM48499.1 UDP-N-acetylmuramyl pentapeptide synthase [Nitrosomonas nitrosa]